MKRYLIISTEQISNVDFSIICETSPETLRMSLDGTKTFIKWNDDGSSNFDSLLNIPNCEGPYSHSEILEILSSSEWSNDKYKI